MVAWILVVHIFGFVLWVGGLLATAVALSQHTQQTSAEARASLARLERFFLRRIGDPGALLTLLAGVALIASNRSYYLHAPWLRIKLVFVATLIGLHGILAAQCKSFASGRSALQPGQVRILLAAIAIVFLLILISTLPGEVFLT
jgi:putative membrane protein